MNIYDAIKKFQTQFAYEPKIVNESKWKKFDKFIVAGMGGSRLAAGLLKVWKPGLDIAIHRNYGLPAFSEKELKSRLIILSSYSGNTEEVLDAYDEAGKRRLSRTAVSIGGKLLDAAKRDGVPYVQMPDTGIQPRSALGFSLKAFLKLVGEEEALKRAGELAKILHPEEYEEEGMVLAGRLKGYVPVIYSSQKNEPLAYSWRIKFNETGKIPAFHNAFPELNHNEMTGFDIKDSTRALSQNFYFIILRDPEDHPKILKRMEVLSKLYRGRGLPVETIDLRGQNIFHKIFSSLVLADWAAYYTAKQYGAEPEQVPMVEGFKKLIA